MSDDAQGGTSGQDGPGGLEGDRLAELLGAALSDDLDDAERRELDGLLARDPAAARELAALRATAGALRASGAEVAPPSDLGARVDRAVRAGGERARRRGEGRGPSRWLAAAAAAAVFAAGGTGGWLLGREGGDDRGGVVAAPVTGPPGTLGALEPVPVDPVPAGVQAQAQVVAHTWGTEAVLDLSGLAREGTYEVLVVGRDGAEAGAGTFVATAGVVRCRLNAAVLRPAAARLVVRQVSGGVVLDAPLPPV